MQIRPARRIAGSIVLPGDKSISHRAAILSSLADGTTEIRNFATSRDCASTIECLKSLGVRIEREGSRVTVHGEGRSGWKSPAGTLDCGNSGTTIRLLAGALSGQGFESVLTGDSSLQSRPMKRVIEPLSMMGAKIGSNDGRAPLHVWGNQHLRPIRYSTPVPSAQVKSAILLAGLYAEGATTVVEKTKTRDHTERMLNFLGAKVSTCETNEGTEITVSGESMLTARDMEVPGDASSAAFFAVAAALVKDSDLTIKGVGMNRSRVEALRFLKETGVPIALGPLRESNNEPMGDVHVSVGRRADGGSAARICGARIADLIDELPILAVYGSQLGHGLEIRDAGELRVKESDRIKAVVSNLKSMGASVEEFEDGMLIRRSKLRGAEIDSFGDHRIAMAFSVAGLIAEGETTIRGAECVDISFPGFFEILEKVCEVH